MSDAASPLAVEEKPSCPKCGIVSRVKKQGVLQRATSSIQNFRCVSCEINFVDPLNRVGCGPPRNDEAREQARELRRSGKTYGEIAEALGCSEHHAYTLVRWEILPNDTKPEQMQQAAGTSGRWKIPDKLARSLSAMFRASNGCTPTQEALDMFVSELLQNAVAAFRMLHRDEVFKAFGRPVLKPTDPCKTIREVVE